MFQVELMAIDIDSYWRFLQANGIKATDIPSRPDWYLFEADSKESLIKLVHELNEFDDPADMKLLESKIKG
ncbi:hypothetical protein [Paraburkholderia sp. BCC1876]|jgi:hypothetical protein|uniref:hypothetical protein n=1 Tax=Paraburkholderia sp. BCC1876 TaxID=2676303 RepID=UPI00159061DD|nr:hypothetical protein [Paraburkholderia sp. BCC1876]